MSEELAPGDPPRIGPYRIIRRLGSGGMGQVFLGRSAGGRPVAVKVIRADLAADPGFRARFRRDVVAARKVTGLYTALLVDADLDGPLPWLATAYVAGPSLAAAVAAHGPLPPASVVMLAAGLAESLTSLHSAGVVHRDLKPSNVLLADDGPRVIDFGISQAAAASGLAQAGSPAFMSPEQAEGGQVGAPSDVFSFGAVLTFAAAGHPPFGDDSASALRRRIVPGTPLLDDVSAEIRALVERCLSTEPSQRPTAPELLAELADTDVSAAWLPEPMTHGQQPALNSTASRSADGGQHSGRRSSRWCQAPPVLVGTLADRNSSAVYAVAFSPRGDVLAAADGNGRVYVWDVASGGPRGQLRRSGQPGRDRRHIRPRQRTAGRRRRQRPGLLVGSGQRRAGPYVRPAAQSGRQRRGVWLGGDVLAAADSSGQVCVWDVVTGDLAASFADPGSQGAMGVAFSPDGAVLAAADGNGRVCIWDVTSGALARVFANPGSQGVNGVAFSPDGEPQAAADGNGRVYLWRASPAPGVLTAEASELI